jgi:hypothetical protein
MSYEITFKGVGLNSITVGNDRGDKIKSLILDGKKDTPIDIDGDVYLIGNIKSVVSAPNPKIDIPEFPSDRLPQGKICHSTRSIQLEINNIARTDFPKTWAKKIQDNKWREAIRQQLRESGVEWCDSKANECICNA